MLSIYNPYRKDLAKIITNPGNVQIKENKGNIKSNQYIKQSTKEVVRIRK